MLVNLPPHSCCIFFTCILKKLPVRWLPWILFPLPYILQSVEDQVIFGGSLGFGLEGLDFWGHCAEGWGSVRIFKINICGIPPDDISEDAEFIHQPLPNIPLSMPPPESILHFYKNPPSTPPHLHHLPKHPCSPPLQLSDRFACLCNNHGDLLPALLFYSSNLSCRLRLFLKTT